ncbi:hypothetical protein N9S81_00320 [bacterium]|nr:hypothetical protein [bacterium]
MSMKYSERDEAKSGAVEEAKGGANESMFFKKDFPAAQIFNFYNANCKEGRSENREFCVEGDGWRRRFAEVRSADALRELVCAKGVRALHAGAVFSERVSNVRKSSGSSGSSGPGGSGGPAAALSRNVVDLDRIKVVGKELVFDLDLQDNPWAAGAKSDMQHNDRFMPLLFASANILQLLLKQVYGFTNFLAVYSGRRGIHLYVLDRRAFALTAEQRQAICESLCLRPHSTDSPFVNTRLWASLSSPELETAVNAAWAAAMGNSENECGMLASKPSVAHFAELFSKWKPPSGWTSPPVPVHASTVFSRLCSESTLKERIDCLSKLNRFAARDVVLAVVWPRLDVQVTASLQHTIKTPFSLHAATGRVAMPVMLDAFTVPVERGGWRPALSALESWRGGELIKSASMEAIRRSTLSIVHSGKLEKAGAKAGAKAGEKAGEKLEKAGEKKRVRDDW